MSELPTIHLDVRQLQDAAQVLLIHGQVNSDEWRHIRRNYDGYEYSGSFRLRSGVVWAKDLRKQEAKVTAAKDGAG